MGSMTIRNINDGAKHNAKLAAAANGRSLEAEIRGLIERTYGRYDGERATRIRAMSGEEFIRHMIATAGGVGLDLPERTTSDSREIFGAD